MDESQRKIRQLLDMGNEIGNHTYSHPDFSHSSPEVVEREIALGQYFLEKWLPSYKIFSLALPFGNSSRPESIAFEGEWQGPPGRGAAPVDVHWKYGAVVRVGSNPAASPLVAGLDPLRLPRIQVYDPAAPDVPKGDAGIAAPNFAHWIDYFERHPDRRYWSDGQRHDPGSLPAEPEPHPKRGRG